MATPSTIHDSVTLPPDLYNNPLHASSFFPRVILHVDLDAFYCQVEMKRLNIDPDMPVAVQQWEGLIAVNYPARKAGITRHERVSDAKKKCPNLILVHVETIAEDAEAPTPSVSTDASVDLVSAEPPQTVGYTTPTPVSDSYARYGKDAPRWKEKVSLERYRLASYQILQVLLRFCSGLERASIDEAYLDVTKQVTQEEVEAGDLCDDSLWTGVVVGGPFQAVHRHDRRLLLGARLAQRIREAVWDECKYTCSAGIAHNKVLAKLGSGMNKPNKQTVVPVKAIPDLMMNLPISKIRLLGGKLGAELKSMGLETAAQAQAVDMRSLESRFGAKSARWLYRIVRGIDESPVVDRDRPQSMAAHKTFPAVNSLSEVERYMKMLATELAVRTVNYQKQYGSVPKTLHLSVRQPRAADRAKTCAMPNASAEHLQHAILQASMNLYRKHGAPLPITALSLQATGFHAGQVGAGSTSIINYFGKAESQCDSTPATMESATKEVVACDKSKTAERHPKGLLRFFHESSSDLTTESSSEVLEPDETARDETQEALITYKCDRCQRLISTHERAEHDDYHVALDLDRSENRGIPLGGSSNSSSQNNHSSSERPKKVQRSSNHRNVHDASIAKFFKK
eukprot:GILJ01008948.1.p1 GENE.GILJ01008948.1~~GILJ01008948.1.p1  ORF type:complete len:626 (+),score=80.08 GILJ01008948.1:116-1993(+)